jgi:glycosyltransferase involved in cell wall biosynthesis
MIPTQKPLRVLYSFPHKLGADRICYTAWQQVSGLAKAGAEVVAMPGVLHRTVPPSVVVHPTLAWKGLRISYKLFGTIRACALHDRIVAHRLEALAGQIDILHAWPLGALETLKRASALGIPTVLERPNAHTRFAYEVVQKECERLGVSLPRGHEHAYNEQILRREEEEYRSASSLLCPSEFTARTFLRQGFAPERLIRHQYGFDENVYYPDYRPRDPKRGLQVLFVGVCAVRKGLHFALEAWLRSSARRDGKFLIAGEFIPEYHKRLAPLLRHSSVCALGHRNDVPELMRNADVMVLPTIEEGFGLVCVEALGCGCVPLVSEACTEFCRHMDNSLVHRIADVEALTSQLNLLHRDRALLAKLRAGALTSAPALTWDAAGTRLLAAYREVLAQRANQIAA